MLLYQIGAKVYLETQLTRQPNMQDLAIVFFFFLLYLITCGISPLKEISLEGIFRSVVYKAQERICIHDRSRRKKEHVGLEHMHFHESISVARVSQKAKKGYVATQPLFHSILHACFTRSTSNIRFTIIKCSLA